MLKNMSETRIPSPPDPLIELADKWEREARRKILSSKLQNDIPSQRPTGEALIQHGAICYFNCAQELRRVLNGQVTDRPLPASVSENTASKTAMQRLCEG
jgi:hypothetical protein